MTKRKWTIFGTALAAFLVMFLLVAARHQNSGRTAAACERDGAVVDATQTGIQRVGGQSACAALVVANVSRLRRRMFGRE